MQFHRVRLGLEALYRFEGHAGHGGMMRGLPGRSSARCTDSGYQPVEAENPLSAAQDVVTFDEPDGWHLVLVPGPGL